MKVTKTLYAKDEFQKIVSIDEDIEKDLLEQFSNKPPPKLFEAQEEKPAENPNAPKAAGILDQKRMTNTLIMLRKFSCSPKEIVDAVRSLDPHGKVLSLENVNMLIVSAFKEEELEMAKNFAAPEEEVAKLNPAECLAYHIARVPRWAMKVKAIMTMRNAEEVEEEIRTSIMTVTNASREVLGSQRLQIILAKILAIGNFLNQGTAKGAARGFKLEALIKLPETKSVEKNQNLLHFIAGKLEEKDPDSLEIAGDMPHVVKAKRISKEDIARELSSFQKAVDLTNREITQICKDRHNQSSEHMGKGGTPRASSDSGGISGKNSTSKNDSDKKEEKQDKQESKDEKNANDESAIEKGDSEDSLTVAKRMCEKAESAVEELKKLQEEMQKTFLEMVVQLGEEPKAAKVEDVFGTLWQFVSMFQQSVKENKQRREEAEQKERMARRAKEDLEKRRLRAQQKAAAKAKDGASSEQGLSPSVGSEAISSPGGSFASPITSPDAKGANGIGGDGSDVKSRRMPSIGSENG